MKTILFFLIILITIAIPADAQQIGLSLSPSLNEILIKPGNSAELTFVIENLADPALVSLNVLPATPAGNSGNLKFRSIKNNPIEFTIKEYSLSEKKSIILKSHESQKITLIINVPENTTVADYYYSLVAQTDPPPGQEGSVTARATIGIASNVLISVMKEYPTETDANIVLFEIPSTFEWFFFDNPLYFVDSAKPFEIVLTLENKSPHRIKPEGKLTIESTFGTKKSYIIGPQNVLAESQRTVQANIPNRKGETSLYLDKLPVGIYTVTAQISIPGTTKRLDSSMNVLSVPFNIVVLILIVMAVLLVLFILSRKKQDPEFESE